MQAMSSSTFVKVPFTVSISQDYEVREQDDKSNLGRRKRSRETAADFAISSSTMTKIRIDLQKGAYLKGHRIQDRLMLSAATITTILYQQQHQKNHSPTVTFIDITFLSPIYPEMDDSDFKFNISKNHESNIILKSQCQQPCVSIRAISSRQRTSTSLDRKEAKKSLNIGDTEARVVLQDDFYTSLKSFGYDYKGKFHSVQEVRIFGSKGTIHLNSTQNLDTLIDGVMQAIVFICLQKRSSRFPLVPFYIHDIVFQIPEKFQRVEDIHASVEVSENDHRMLGSFHLVLPNLTIFANGIHFRPLILEDKAHGCLTRTHEILPANPTKLPESIKVQENGKVGSTIFKSDLLKKSGHKEVVIESFACRLPNNVHDPAELWDTLKTGRNLSSKIPYSRIMQRDLLARGEKYINKIQAANFIKDDVAEFDATFFDISKSEAEKIDPQQRLLIECVYECMENSGLKTLSDTGFFIGLMANEYPTIIERYDVLSMLGSSASLASGRLNYLFDSKSPGLTVDTACSSSLVAMKAAINGLLNGDCKYAIVAGVNLILTAKGMGQRANGSMLCNDGNCKSFDASADGYGRADGCVALLITLGDSSTQRDTTENVAHDTVEKQMNKYESMPTTRYQCDKHLAIVVCNEINHNGRSASLTAPNLSSQRELLKNCLKRVSANSKICYWEAHGTGTPIGDAIELNVLKEALSGYVGSAKSRFGHTEAAAGAVGLAKIVTQLQHGYIPEHGHYKILKDFKETNIFLPIVGVEENGDFAGLSSFGISGTNSMSIIRKPRVSNATKAISESAQGRFHVCPLSAKNETSLKMIMKEYEKMLTSTNELYYKVCATAALNRNHMKFRAALIIDGTMKVSNIVTVMQNHQKNLAVDLSDIDLNTIYYLSLRFTKYRNYLKTCLENLNIEKDGTDFYLVNERTKYQLSGLISLYYFLNGLGVMVDAIIITDKLAILFPSVLRALKLSYVSKSEVVILPKNSSKLGNFEKIKFSGDCKTLDHEFATLIAEKYVSGIDIHWHVIYEQVPYIRLPNYQFDRKVYWQSERPSAFEHELLGAPISWTSQEACFANQLTRMSISDLFSFTFNNKPSFTYGFFCEVIMETVDALNECGTKKTVEIANLSYKSFTPQDGMWISTKVTLTDTVSRNIVAETGKELLCNATVILHDKLEESTKSNSDELLISDIGCPPDSIKALPKFYAQLSTIGLDYQKHCQIVSGISENGRTFKMVPSCKIRTNIEAAVQVACYSKLLKPDDIYGDTGKTGLQFKVYNTDIVGCAQFLVVDDRQVTVCTDSGNAIVALCTETGEDCNIAINQVQNTKKEVDEPFQREYEKSHYDKCVQAVIDAINDIRVEKFDDIDESTTFAQLSLDSLALVDLNNRLQERYFQSLRLSIVDYFNYSTIGALAKAIWKEDVQLTESEVPQERLPRHTDSNFESKEDDRKQCSKEAKFVNTGTSSNCRVYVQQYIKPHLLDGTHPLTLTDNAESRTNAIVFSKREDGWHHDKRGKNWFVNYNGDHFEKVFKLSIKSGMMTRIQFHFSNKYPRQSLIKILLTLTKIISNSKQQFEFLPSDNYGRNNAYATGFVKSFAAEYYPRVKFVWDFYLEVLPEQSHRANCSENDKQISARYKTHKEIWLITGGLKGIGWEMAKWIAINRNVGRIYLLGRTPPNLTKQKEIEELRQHTSIIPYTVDITSTKHMDEFFENLAVKLTGIIHSAGSLQDALAIRQTVQSFEEVSSAKCTGLLLLTKLCSKYKHSLEQLIVNSSISSILGNFGQCNYSAANAYVDEYVQSLRKKGILGTVVNWGNWLETGMAVNSNSYLANLGFMGIATTDGLSYMKYILDVKPERMILACMDVDKVVQKRPDLKTVLQRNLEENQPPVTGTANSRTCTARKAKQVPRIEQQYNHQKPRGKNSNAAAVAGKKSPTNHNQRFYDRGAIIDAIIEAAEIAGGIRIDSTQYHTGFMEIGLQSFVLYKFAEVLQEKFKSSALSILTLFEKPTVEQLCEYLCDQKKKEIKDFNNASVISTMKNNTKCLQTDCAPIKKIQKFKTKFYVILLENASSDYRKEAEKVYKQLQNTAETLDEIMKEQIRYVSNQNYAVWGTKRYEIMKNLRLTQQESTVTTVRKPVICFMFTGQHSQVWNMGHQLCYIFPKFRKIFTRTLRYASKYMSNDFNSDILNVLLNWKSRSLIYKTEYAQIIVFCFAYALARLYESCGVHPDYCVGHSIGELVAHTLAGRFDLEDALKIVIARGRALSTIQDKGMMIAVSRANAKKLLKVKGVHVAAYNSDKQVVLSGTNRAIAACVRKANENGYYLSVIDDKYPFHCQLIGRQAVEVFRKSCDMVKISGTTKIPVVSSRTGEIYKHFIVEDLVNQLTSTVHFNRCIQTLDKADTNVWLEIGYGETLSTIVKSTLRNSNPDVLIKSSIICDRNELKSFLASLKELQSCGVKVNWKKVAKQVGTLSHKISNANKCESKLLPHETFECRENWKNEEVLQEAKKIKMSAVTDTFSELANEHIVDGKLTVPAAALVAFTVDWFKFAKPTTFCKLIFRQPIYPSNIDNLHIFFDITSLTIKTTTDFIHFQCKLHKGTKYCKPLADSELPITKGRKIPTELFYELQRKRGIQYGPNFTVLRDIYRKHRKVWANLYDVENLAILIDGALQALSAAAFTKEPVVHVPLEIGFFSLLRKQRFGDRFTVYAEVTQVQPQCIKGNATVFQEKEQVLYLNDVIAITKNFSDVTGKQMDHSNGKVPKLGSNKSVSRYSQGRRGNPGFIEPKSSSSLRYDESSKYSKMFCVNNKEYPRPMTAVISYAGRFSNTSTDMDYFWNDLKSSRQDRARTQSRTFQESISLFDPEFFGISLKEAVYIDPQQRVLLELAHETLAKAPFQEDRNIGVFIGVSSNDFIQKSYAELDNLNAYLSTGTNNSTLAGRIAFRFNLTGPTIVVDTACSSFLTALSIASDNIKEGRCTAALVGAVNLILNTKTTSVLKNAKMLSNSDTCKVFDADADGYIRSDGAVMVLIKSFQQESGTKMKHRRLSNLGDSCHNATKAIIASYALGHTGASSGLTVPRADSESKLISSAIASSGSTRTDWVEAHATGTALGDPIEMAAIANVLKENQNPKSPYWLTSVKSALGHCEAAASGASLLKILHSLQNGYITPQQHFKILNPIFKEAPEFVIPIVGEEIDDDVNVIINSFGFTGANISLMLRSTRNVTPREPTASMDEIHKQCSNSSRTYCVVLSSKSEKSLGRLKDKVREYLSETCESLDVISNYLKRVQAEEVCKKYDHYRSGAILNRHTGQLTFVDEILSEKKIKLLVLLDENLQPEDVYYLMLEFDLFRKIFTFIFTKRSGTSHILLRHGFKMSGLFNFSSKLALLRFLCLLGVIPDIIVSWRKTSQLAANAFLRNMEEVQSGSVKKLPKFVDRLPQEYDDYTIFPILNQTNGKISSVGKHLLEILLKYHCEGHCINWGAISKESCHPCRIPWYEYDKRSFWPFGRTSSSNVETCKGQYASLSQASENQKTNRNITEFERLQYTDQRAEEDSQIDTGECMKENDWQKYIYKISYYKKELTLSSVKQYQFVAINLKHLKPLLGKEALFSMKMHDREDLSLIKDKLINSGCMRIAFEWYFDDSALDKCSVSQSLLLIELGLLLDNIYCEKTKQLDRTIRRPCLMVYVISLNGTSVGISSITGCEALLKTLISEIATLDYKYIVSRNADDSRLISEITFDSDMNESIRYENGERYVQRLVNTTVSPRQSSVNRVLFTGSVNGIASKLISTLKPIVSVVVSRSCEEKSYSTNMGKTRLYTIPADCTSKKRLSIIFKKFAPFDVIFHCAGLVDNAPVRKLNRKQFQKVYSPKVIGLRNIITLAETYQIKKIVVFSSAATVLGSPGQANYCVSNRIMEQMTCACRSNDLVISWGPWSGVGLLTDARSKTVHKQIQKRGWRFMKPEMVAEICSKLLYLSGHYLVMDVDFDVFRRTQVHLKGFLQYICMKNAVVGEKTVPLIQISLDSRKSSAERRSYIEHMVLSVIENVSGIKDLELNIGFMNAGIDSLMISDIRNKLNKMLKIDLNIADFYDHCTVNSVTDLIMKFMKERNQKPCTLPNRFEAAVSKNHGDIVIAGYSGAFSGAKNDDIFWKNLLGGKESLSLTTSYEADNSGEIISSANTMKIGMVPGSDKFDYRFFKLSYDDASYLDPQIRKFVEHAYIALERSGLVKLKSKLRIGVIAGAEPTLYQSKRRASGTLRALYARNQKDFVATWTSYLLDLHGPSFGVYSACSSGLLAVTQGINLLRSGECDAIIAGAVSLVLPKVRGWQKSNGLAMSPSGCCRPFDHQSDGTVQGSSVVAVVLKKVPHNSVISSSNLTLLETVPPIANIVGYGLSNDGERKASFMAPNVYGQRACIERAIKMAGTKDVVYIECHGTGTAAGDSIEFMAMRDLYDQETYIGSVKANIGHTFAGAGCAGLIKLCKIAENKIIPKQINFEKFNDELPDLNYKVPTKNISISSEKPIKLAVSSFGIGGTNVHLIIEKTIALEHKKICQPVTSKYHILPISAASEWSCLAACKKLAKYLETETVNLSMVASTLQHYRESFPYRIAVVAQNNEEARNNLLKIKHVERVTKLDSKNLGYYFAPQGLEYPEMWMDTVIEDNVYRETLGHCFKLAAASLGKRNKSNSGNKTDCRVPFESSTISEQPYSQLAMFSLCYSITKQLSAWGIESSELIGHSVGEYAAAAYSDVFDIGTAMKILSKRGELFASTMPAKMIAIKLENNVSGTTNAETINIENIDDFEKSFQDLPDSIEVSAVLSKSLRCIVGKPKEIEKFVKSFTCKNIRKRDLNSNYGYHSSFMKPILKELREFCKKLFVKKKCEIPTKKILSNIDGCPVRSFDADYIIKHTRSTVRIDKCIKNLSENIKVIITIGPTSILKDLIAYNNREINVINTVPSKKQRETGKTYNLYDTVAKLWSLGYDIDWKRISSVNGFLRSLPNYSFEKTVCWQDSAYSHSSDDVNLYRQCWTDTLIHPETPSPTVLLFLPESTNKQIKKFLIDLHNHCISVQIVKPVPTRNRSVNHTETETLTVNDDAIYIDLKNEEAYRMLGTYLQSINFNYSLIYHAWNLIDGDSSYCNLNKSYYSIQWIRNYLLDSKKNITVVMAVSERSSPEVNASVVVIRELRILGISSQAVFIKVDDSCDLFTSLSIVSAKHSNSEILAVPFATLRQATNRCEQLLYQKIHDSRSSTPLIYNEDVVVVFGGFGTLGQTFIDVLCREYHSLKIHVLSRNANERFESEKIKQKRMQWEESKPKKPNLINAYNVNITDSEQVRRNLGEFIRRYGHINVIIHAAGVSTKQGNQIQAKEEPVYYPKIHGTHNIIDALYDLNIKIRALILNSSLNGMLGLPGDTDYAIGNVYQDEIAHANFSYIERILTIQWTGWRENGMLQRLVSSNISSSEVTKLIYENSITQAEAEQMIVKCLQCQGLVAVSTVKPNKIVEQIERIISSKLQRMTNYKEHTNTQRPNGTENTRDVSEMISEDSQIMVASLNAWKNALSLKHLKPDDDFFELGGNSLNGMQIIWEVERNTRVKVKLNDLYEHPNFTDFCSHITKNADTTISPKKKSTIEENSILDERSWIKKVPLTFAQEGMYILRQLEEATLYNISYGISMYGQLCRTSFKKALHQVIAKQTSLRTSFHSARNDCHQIIHSLTESYYHLSWSYLSKAKCMERVKLEKEHEFDLKTIPLRFLAYRTCDCGSDNCDCNSTTSSGREKHLLIVSHHHIITDGWSVTLFANDISNFYNCYLNGHALEVEKKLRTTIADYAFWQRDSSNNQKLLDGARFLAVRLKDAQPSRIISHSSGTKKRRMQHLNVNIPTKLWNNILEIARIYKKTTYIITLSAFICIVRRFSEDWDNKSIVIGCVTSGRIYEELMPIIGYFLNNFVLKIDNVSLKSPKMKSISKIIEAVDQARSFEYVPFHLLVSELKQKREENKHPIFEIFFNYRHDFDFPQVKLSNIDCVIQQLTSNDVFDFACTIDETSEGSILTFDYNSVRYDSKFVQSIASEYLKILKAMTTPDSGERLRIPSLSNASYGEVQEIPKGITLPDIIEMQTQMTSDLYSFTLPDQRRMTYDNILKQAIHLAKDIQQFYLKTVCNPICADTVIPLCLAHNNIIVPILATLLAGAAYAPIDSANSSQLLNELITLVNGAIIITDKEITDLCVPTLLFHPDSKNLKDNVNYEIRSHTSDYDCVYTIFTSGSTGKPKGVCISNENLTNFVTASSQQIYASPGLRVYHSVSTCFDVSVMNIFTSFANGACLVGSENRLKAPEELVKYSVDFTFLPSALFDCFSDNEIKDLKNLKRICVGGESPSSYQINKFLKAGISVRQIYGPTEATAWALTNVCALNDYDLGHTIGKALCNELAFLLDSEGDRMHYDGVGELAISGKGIARGYLQNLSSENFVCSKYICKENTALGQPTRYYKTGDLARKIGDRFLYLGRKDMQIKVRGYRVEPSEIENAARQFDKNIRHAVVINDENLGTLILFIEADKIDQKRLRIFLANKLLHFMVPQRIVVLKRLLLTVSGKIDRQKLIKLARENITDNENTEKEEEKKRKQLLQLWENATGVSNFYENDDFFTIGGNSLSLIRLHNSLQEELHYNLDYKNFYKEPTFNALAQHALGDIENKTFNNSNESVPGELNSNGVTKEGACKAYSNNVITTLRETDGATRRIYLIHAIGGTVYPYYSIITALPSAFNVYAIGYKLDYPCTTIDELADFYAQKISEHSAGSYANLMGHSLGGTLAREIVERLYKNEQKPSFVIMLDPWATGVENLDEQVITEKLEKQLSQMDDKQSYIKRTRQLLKMLKVHKFKTFDTKLYILKAATIGESVIAGIVKGKNPEAVSRSMHTNGFQQYTTKPIVVYLVDSGHDTMMHPNHVSSLKKIFSEIFDENDQNNKQ